MARQPRIWSESPKSVTPIAAPRALWCSTNHDGPKVAATYAATPKSTIGSPSQLALNGFARISSFWMYTKYADMNGTKSVCPQSAGCSKAWITCCFTNTQKTATSAARSTVPATMSWPCEIVRTPASAARGGIEVFACSPFTEVMRANPSNSPPFRAGSAVPRPQVAAPQRGAGLRRPLAGGSGRWWFRRTLGRQDRFGRCADQTLGTRRIAGRGYGKGETCTNSGGGPNTSFPKLRSSRKPKP